ncbi:MAG: NAD+ synthase (glutamine-hydrolyzing) [Polyangiales bacterium]|jgi:NAD+ synthase (glutamine-hydrolysing)
MSTIGRVHYGVGILNQTPFAWDANERNIRRAIDEARAVGVQVLCLPELCITGYGCEDMFHASALHDTAWERMLAIAPATKGMVVCVGLPVELRGAVYNCAALLVDGELKGLVAKRFLAGDGIHYEPRWFKPWPEGEITTVRRDGREVPIGDLSFDVDGLRIGFEICEDAWVAHRPGARLSLQGTDVIMNPSASHFAFGKQNIRRRLVLEGSRAFGVTYLYANLLGNESGRAIFDGGGLIAAAGAFLAETRRFSFDDVSLAHVIIDVNTTRLARARSSSFRPEPEGDETVRCDFEWVRLAPDACGPLEPRDYSKEEAFARTVALGLMDYLRKTYSKGYIVSLSGGADSSACAALVRLVVDIGVSELGLEGFLRRLSHIPELAECQGNDALTRCLLTTAYQATRNSGDVTKNAARELAEALGAEHHELDVDAIVQGYIALTEGALGRPLTWEQDDITLQNIQARSRGPSIWMLANVKNAILLATSNRSEAAVGYATMDGDTCGGLSPIAGIDKAFLRRWLSWMEKEGLAESGAWPALASVTAQAPTAELRPSEDEQTDEGDLMPYPVLDAIERHAVRDKKFPQDTYEMMRAEHPDVSAAQMRVWVTKFFTLWCRNQWKRERYAPSFHLDDKNLDPKTWCRFPILSGGFALELKRLAEALD